MVWGGITARNRAQLVIIDGNLNAATYRDEVLAPVVVPFLQRHGPALFCSRTTPDHKQLVLFNSICSNNK
jgi:hypothetical protein